MGLQLEEIGRSDLQVSSSEMGCLLHYILNVRSRTVGVRPIECKAFFCKSRVSDGDRSGCADTTQSSRSKHEKLKSVKVGFSASFSLIATVLRAVFQGAMINPITSCGNCGCAVLGMICLVLWLLCHFIFRRFANWFSVFCGNPTYPCTLPV